MVIIRKHFAKEYLYPQTEQNEPKDLPKHFEGKGETNGFTFSQIRCSNKVCLYHVSDTFGNAWYEVFTSKLNRLYGTFYYPKPKAFGVSAWTCKTLERAEQKFNSLLLVNSLNTSI